MALRGYTLDLGSVHLPMPLHIAFLAVWGVFGSFAAVALAYAIADRDWLRRALDAARGSADRKWLIYGCAAAFLLPLSIRILVLRDMPLTDDESSYRFMAELLASGRLWAESPPLKIFFDRGQMINDGKLYAQYFLGWPMLMVPGVWLGFTGLMNPLYAALTVPPLYGMVRRQLGRAWAQLALLLYLSSPLLMIGAATELSHTSCVMALAYVAWFFGRTRDAGGWIDHAGLALAFSVAFFIRPQSALALGLPFLVLWLVARWREPERRAARLLAFALPALVMAGLFFAVNHLQTGSATKVAYQQALDYAQENDGQFVSDAQRWDVDVAHLRFDRSPVEALGHVGIGLFRLNFALFGWPLSLFFVALAGSPRGTGPWWAGVGLFLAAHLPATDAGIDSFGPVHYFELALPALVLSCVGVRRLARHVASRGDGEESRRWQLLPLALVVALVMTSLAGYVPVRLKALGSMAENIEMPRDAVYRAGLERAIVFAPWPYAPNCRSYPTQFHVRFRPNNDPDLDNDVLWVNHLSVVENRQLMAHFPDRLGYVMVWSQDCEVQLLPLDALAEGQVRDGRRRKASRRSMD